MVERVLCKHEVVGSIPSSSTGASRRRAARDDADKDGRLLAIGRNKVLTAVMRDAHGGGEE